MRYFIQASYDQSLLDTAGRHRVTHALTRRDTGIDTYVVVVGESARRANWGLYGYARDTTPRAAAERDRMTLYTQAAAPAPLTIMAVPLTLSAATVDSYDPRLFGDNVVALAGDAGFRTYWLSNQARLGRYDTPVTAMANMAHFKTWADAPYDEALLPLLDAALAEPGRKVVFLHINGNHDNYCTRYPETATVYQGGAPYEDCYDIIHCNGSADHKQVMLATLGLRRRPRIVFTKHNDHPLGSLGNRLRATLATDHSIAVSAYVHGLLADSPYSRHPITTVRHGIDTDYYAPPDAATA
ncbi:sulfatase-like hydrolase/transferase, partial [Bordetella bronchiseptica]|uniref:sulfatase-like hydrolase/transferase n=1 Tax=Bordetella bronchiseptica TaxID=518 RepID=UPI001F243FF9